MPYTPNYVPGDILSAAAMNSIGDWQTYTPTWTATVTNPTLGNGTAGGVYCQINKLVIGMIGLNGGTTTTYGSGVYLFSLPVTAGTNMNQTQPVGTGWIQEMNTVVNYNAQVLIYNSTKVSMVCFASSDGEGGVTDYTFAADVKHNVPLTWRTTSPAQTPLFRLHFVYQAA